LGQGLCNLLLPATLQCGDWIEMAIVWFPEMLYLVMFFGYVIVIILRICCCFRAGMTSTWFANVRWATRSPILTSFDPSKSNYRESRLWTITL
jgi:hypothetical protein